MLDYCRLNVAWDIVNSRFCLLTIIMRQTLGANRKYQVWHSVTNAFSHSHKWMDHFEWSLTWKLMDRSVLYWPFCVAQTGTTVWYWIVNFPYICYFFGFWLIWLSLCGSVRFGGIRKGRFNFWMQSNEIKWKYWLVCPVCFTMIRAE